MDYSAAEQILSINNNNLERAINFHLEGHPIDTEGAAGPSNQIAGSSSSGIGGPNVSPLLPNMPTLVSLLYILIIH